jgi:hypothetical protein
LFVKRINIRSTDQISDTGERWIVYPVISNSSVTGLVAGILNKEETTVEFRNLKPGNEYYDQLIPLFREQFQKSLISARQLNRNGKCGFPMQPPCEIDVIIITPPNSGGGIGIGIGGGGGEGTPKPCSKYENCIHNDPGGGGGGGSNGLGWKGPCEKLKEQNTPDFKANRNLLETNLNMKGETGFVEKHNGSFEYKDQSSTNEDSNSLSLGNPTSDMKGFMHTHVNDFTDSDGNTRIGFKIFSPADVIYFNQMVAIAHQNGIPLENIYAVMVSGSGTYQIRFTGSAYQIKTTYANTKVQYNEMYKDYFIKNKDRSNEMNFLKFIDEQMYVKGVTLIKMNSDGTNTKKTLNFAKDDVDDTNCL